MATPPIPHTHVPEHVSEVEADNISRVSRGGPGLRNPQKRSRRRRSFSLSDLLRPARFSQGPDTTFANSYRASGNCILRSALQLPLCWRSEQALLRRAQLKPICLYPDQTIVKQTLVYGNRLKKCPLDPPAM